MKAFIESKDNKGRFFLAHVVENQYGVYQWQYEHNANYVSLPFKDIDDAVSVLREARKCWEDSNVRVLIVQQRQVRLTLDELDLPEEDTIVED